MNCRRSLTLGLGFLGAALLGGCVASQNPLGPASEAVSEPGLAGTWLYDGDKGDAWNYLHVLPGEDGKSMEIVVVNSAEKGWLVLAGHVTSVGEQRYINLQVAAAAPAVKADLDKDPRAKTHSYSFVAYRLEGDGRLTLAYPLGPLHAAVKNGQLAGETVGDYDAFISDNPAKIAAVLGAVSAAELYKDAAVYRRISPAP